MANYVNVKPEILRWAIDRSGLPLDEYKEAVRLWVEGNKQPTYNQLESFAKRAMVPLGYLFLASPPHETLPVPDYRTRRDEGVRRPSPNLIETIFEMQRRQEWMRSYLLDEGSTDLAFVGSTKVGDSTESVAEKIRQNLKLNSDWASQESSYEEALRLLRHKIEDAGILIFINGIVGNNTKRKLDPDEFQGFVLVDQTAPLIFVNGADYKVAQMFTIAHELAHVWIGQSALFDLVATEPSDQKIELYCNSVAAEFLVPSANLEQAWATTSTDGNAIHSLAKSFKVSPIVLARRCKDLQLITTEEFFSFYNKHMKQEKTKFQARKPGGDFWRTQNVRLGRRFGSAVIAAAKEGRISYSDAYSLTRLYGDTFDKYANLLEENA